MRVLHIVDRWRRGGTERNVEYFVRSELARGREVSLALLGSGGTPDVPDSIAVHRFPRTRELTNPFEIARAVIELRSLIERESYDIVHTHKSKAGVVGRLAARGRAHAIVHTAHMASFGAAAYGRFPSAAYLRAERRCAHFTDVIVTVGAELRDTYLDARVGTPSQYALVRSPVALGAFFAVREWPEERRFAARAELGLPHGARLAVMVGLLEPRKRPRLVLRALAPLLDTGQVVLALAGEGPEEESVRTLAAELGVEHAVRLLGHVTDPAPLFAAADVIVHGSRAEGTPQVLLQALAAGVPMVATEVEGLREVPAAPIRIVDRSGRGLADAVRRQLADRPAPVPVGALAAWTPASIDAQQQELHDRVDRIVSARRTSVG